jgi:hypothetical protein
VVRQAYGDAMSSGMQIGAVVALIGLVAVILIRETPLRTSVTDAVAETVKRVDGR